MVDFDNELVPQTLKLNHVVTIPFEKYVLKHVGRSGCKGIYFHDQDQDLNPDECIVQEFVQGQEFEFSYFEDSTLIMSGGWQVRLITTLDLKEFRVVYIDVTARQYRLVHGAIYSIQIAGVRKN